MLWHVESPLSDGAAAAPDEVVEGDDPPVSVAAVVPGDEGDTVGGPAVTVVFVPPIVVSISADDGPAGVVVVPPVVACRGTTALAMMPLASTKRMKRRERTAMAIKERASYHYTIGQLFR